MASQIRVAIIGGGIGGCTLANSLLKHPHIEFDVFEGSSAFKEQGLAVGLSPNALGALELIGPNLRQSIHTAGGVTENSAHFIMGEGPERNTLIYDSKKLNETAMIVHRGLFLKELLKDIPESHLHVNKKLQRIERNNDTNLLTLHFEDGTTDQYHAVIGSDGIRSTVRSNVLSDHPESIEPSFAGFWDVRAGVPIEVAREAGILNDSSPESMWLGNGGYIIHQLMNEGQLLGCIVAGVANESYDGSKWRNPVDRAFLEKALGDRGEFGENIVSIMLDQLDSEPFAFSQYQSAKAPTYSNGSVCIMGDAAHAMTPWQGSGAGTSIEDAMILDVLLGKITDPSQVPAALKAYDEVRRPRTQKIMDSSREVGLASCGQDPFMGLDVQKLREGLPPKWDFIHKLDIKQHVADALTALQRNQK